MSVRQTITDIVTEQDLDVVFLEPAEYDNAIIGLYWDDNGTPHIAYDKDKILDMHIKDGMSEDEAEEFFSYNTIRALPYMGASAPIIIEVMKEEKAIEVQEVFSDDHREAQEN